MYFDEVCRNIKKMSDELKKFGITMGVDFGYSIKRNVKALNKHNKKRMKSKWRK